MQRRHFNAIARACSDVKERVNRQGMHERHTAAELQAMETAIDTVSKQLANTLWAFNDNFDKARFLAACGVED